jgi:hypothetical protein
MPAVQDKRRLDKSPGLPHGSNSQESGRVRLQRSSSELVASEPRSVALAGGDLKVVALCPGCGGRIESVLVIQSGMAYCSIECGGTSTVPGLYLG